MPSTRPNWLFLSGLMAHAIGLTLWIHWGDVLQNPPIHYRDYANHYATAWSIDTFLEEGRLWGYSPYFHAGYPCGTLFDADNKGLAVLTAAFHQLGLSQAHAFNLVILSWMLLAPLLIYPSARMLGLGRRGSGLALWIGIALWYGDPVVNWTWRGGTLAFGTMSFAAVLVLSAFLRWSGATRNTRTLGAGLLWFILGPLLFWIHPWAFFTLGVPIAVVTVRLFRQWDWYRRVLLFIWAGWVLLLNWPWLGTVLRFLPDKTSSAQYLQGGIPQLAEDLGSPLTLLRGAVLLLGAAGIWVWRRDSRGIRQGAGVSRGVGVSRGAGVSREVGAPFGVSMIVWVLLAYGGVYIGAGDLQPYRFIIPALAVATIPAADFLHRNASRTPRRGWILLLLLILSAGPALYMARPRGRTRSDGTPRDHLSGPRPIEHAVCETLRGLDLDRGRVLTNDWRLGAYLPTCCGAQMIGGPFLHVWTRYGYVNAGLETFLGKPLREFSAQRMREELDRYNVHWVVINRMIHPLGYTLGDWIDDHPQGLERIGTHGVLEVYALEEPSNWFTKGGGRVQAEHDRIRVRDAEPGGAHLKFHWIESLRTTPPLPIYPLRSGDDPVPFIGVDNGEVTHFDIVLDAHRSDSE